MCCEPVTLGQPPGRLELHLVTGRPVTLACEGLPVGAVLAIRDHWARPGVRDEAGVTRWALTVDDVGGLAGAERAQITLDGVVLLAGPIRWTSGWEGYCSEQTVVYVAGARGETGPQGEQGPPW